MPTKKQQIKSLKTKVILLTVLLVFAGMISIVQVGKAQQTKNSVEQLTAFADSVGGDQTAFMAGLEYLGNQVGEMLGASGSRFPNGISADTTSPSSGQVRGTTFTVTNTLSVSGDATFGTGSDVIVNATSTLPRPDATIVIPLTLSATTTATTGRNVAGTHAQEGNAQLCYGPEVYLWDAVAGFGWSMGVGTTTYKDGTYLTATTSRTLLGDTRINTTTQDIGWNLYGGFNTSTAELVYGHHYTIYADTGAGYASGTPWLLDSGDVIVVDFTDQGATSTASFTNGAAATDLTPGAVYFNCFNVY